MVIKFKAIGNVTVSISMQYITLSLFCFKDMTVIFKIVNFDNNLDQTTSFTHSVSSELYQDLFLVHLLMGDGGGGHWLVRVEWRPAGWSVCLPLAIFPCTIKSRSSLLAPAHPGGSGKRDVKRLCACAFCFWFSMVH